jgi:N utilization substance protein B
MHDFSLYESAFIPVQYYTFAGFNQAMISRRNIRVEVMQTLYSLATVGQETPVSKKNASVILDEKLNRGLDLFVTAILYVIRVAEYAEADAHLRASKYLPTEADKNVSIKIAGNTYVWKIKSDESFIAKIKEAGIEQYVAENQVRKIYQQLIQTPEYLKYIGVEKRDEKAEKAIIRFIWEQLMLKNEELQNYFLEELPGWEDDKDMTAILMENFFKHNTHVSFLHLISAEKREYAHLLTHTVLDKEAYCTELIQPKLINWEAERVALIDLLLLRMGICELLYFPTIPTRVTINEYIEIAKVYSTPQSGQFINGVLDNILKDLEKENKIRKQARVPHQ